MHEVRTDSRLPSTNIQKNWPVIQILVVGWLINMSLVVFLHTMRLGYEDPQIIWPDVSRDMYTGIQALLGQWVSGTYDTFYYIFRAVIPILLQHFSSTFQMTAILSIPIWLVRRKRFQGSEVIASVMAVGVSVLVSTIIIMSTVDRLLEHRDRTQSQQQTEQDAVRQH